MQRGFSIILLSVIAAGCATTPDVTVTYYPPIAHAKITVTQTLDCDKANSRVIAVNSVSDPAVTYRADRSQPHPLRLRDLDGTLADTSVTFTLAEDGRLKGLNATTTGQGETILKSAITLATSLPLAVRGGPHGLKAASACVAIANWGKGKPVTLIYFAEFESGSLPTSDTAFQQEADSEALYQALRAAGTPDLDVVLHAGQPTVLQPATANVSASDIALTLNKVQSLPLQVLIDTKPIWSRDVILPSEKTYTLPVPKAAVFGKQVFILQLADSGAITQLGYETDTGAAGALNVGSAIATAMKSPSAAEEAAAIKAQGDLIAAQQRLAHCRANPAGCV